MKTINETPISELKEFKRGGYLTKYVANDGLWYLFSTEGGFKIVRAVKHKQPDGSEVYCYPSSEQFGVSGWHICGNKANRLRSLKMIKKKCPDFNIEYFADFILISNKF